MASNFRPLACALALAAGLATPLASAEVVKVAFIEPLSGPFAAVGQNLLRSWQSMAELGRLGKWAGDDWFRTGSAIPELSIETDSRSKGPTRIGRTAPVKSALLGAGSSAPS